MLPSEEVESKGGFAHPSSLLWSATMRVCLRPSQGESGAMKAMQALGPLAGPGLRSQGSKSGRRWCNLQGKLGGF